MKHNNFEAQTQTLDSNVYTKTSTTGTTTSYWTNPSYQSEKGWECPRCGRINAPWKSQCDCSTRNNWYVTGNYEEPWWKQIYDSDTFKVHPETTTWKTPSSTCESDSATVAKSDPNCTIYTTAHNEIVGGSDHWNPNTKTWENVSKDISNMQQELDELKYTFSNTLKGE